jgi:hypothetical protein
MPTSGDVNNRFGVYQNLCCGIEIVISGGSTFPVCPNHPGVTTEWQPVDSDACIRHINDFGDERK